MGCWVPPPLPFFFQKKFQLNLLQMLQKARIIKKKPLRSIFVGHDIAHHPPVDYLPINSTFGCVSPLLCHSNLPTIIHFIFLIKEQSHTFSSFNVMKQPRNKLVSDITLHYNSYKQLFPQQSLFKINKKPGLRCYRETSVRKTFQYLQP